MNGAAACFLSTVEKAKRQRCLKRERSLLRMRQQSDQGTQEAKGHACFEKAKRHRYPERERSLLWMRNKSDRAAGKAKGHACSEKAKNADQRP